jgi:lipoate-protein ligase B
MEYRRALDLQLSLVDRRARGEAPDTLLLVTHPHVYTFGRSTQPANLLVSEDDLRREGISVERIAGSSAASRPP